MDFVKSFVHATPRHFIYIVFVDSQIAESALRDIFHANLHIWGGRYNPVIPVHDNKIEDSWKQFLNYYDADKIYYTKGIEIEKLKADIPLNPLEYVELIDQRIPYFPGINIHNLLHEHVDGRIGREGKLTILRASGANEFLPAIKNFYGLNLGLKDLYSGEDKFTKNYEVIEIDEKTVDNLVILIAERNPYFKTLLSTVNIQSVILKNGNRQELNDFQFIVYDKSNYLDDLLYFWNRQLFISPDNRLHQIIASLDELEEVMKDKNFQWILYRLNPSDINLVSHTLDEEQMETLRVKLQNICTQFRVFKYKVKEFPYSIIGSDYPMWMKKRTFKNVLLGKSDLLNLPKPIFEEMKFEIEEPYVIDLEIEKDSEDQHRFLNFPLNANLHIVFGLNKARVNLKHTFSIYPEPKEGKISISIPSNYEIIRSILQSRIEKGNQLNVPLQSFPLSNAGQRLFAFFNLLDRDWHIVDHFLSDKFWLQLFRSDSDVSHKSPIYKGKGIFSYFDIEVELRGLYKKYYDSIKAKITSDLGNEANEEFMNSYIERKLKDDFAHFIDDDLQYLVRKNALFIGMKVKCLFCGSNTWYSLAELNHKMQCKGCFNEIIPSIKGILYYRLNEIITSNLLSDHTKNAKTFDGNYVVLKTLLQLKSGHRNCNKSFIWVPSLDLKYNINGRTKSTDIDIVALQDGKFILGEAKSDASDFNNDEINTLIWIGNNLLPDIIILAYNSGKLGEKLDRVKAGITNKQCNVVECKTYEPWYKFGGLFGLPNDTDD